MTMISNDGIPKAESYELKDFGVQDHQYFQGFGVCGTKFDACVTGCGIDAKSAMEDALINIAENGTIDADELEDRICRDEGWQSLADAPTEPTADHDGMYYYVGIRWKNPPEVSTGN